MFGYGSDGELTHPELYHGVGAVAVEGGLLGAWGLSRAVGREIERLLKMVPTDASRLPLKVSQGEVGNYTVRDGKRTVEPTPASTVTFYLETAAVADRSAATDAIDDYVSNLTDSTDDLQQSLSGAEFGTFDLIWRALRFDYSRRLNEARRLRADYEETLDEDANEALDDVIQQLTFFGPVREHIKTLYFQWELINLSRAMLYLSVPALAVIGIFLMYVDLGAVTGSTLGIDNLVWVASAGFVVGMSPFVVFISYILRIITVAKLTLAIGPFTLQGERDE